MRLLLIDNYDSFTYNLFQLLAEVAGEVPVVVRNDAVPSATLGRGEFDGVVISPGPGRPDVESDFGACREVILGSEVPVLGVCLGHQGIATAFGGKVERAEPVHGQATRISHDGAPMFAGLPNGFRAVRYHSLVVEDPLPSCLRATAWSDDDAVMALAHVERPIWGVQFHPESAGTPLGRLLIQNFLAQVGCRRGRASRPAAGLRARVGTPPGEQPTRRIIVRSLGHLPDPATAFGRLFGGDRFAFWLDREAAGEGWASGCSVMGSADGPGSEVLTYEIGSGVVSGLAPATDDHDVLEGTIFEVLRRRLRERGLTGEAPFEFSGGYVGYLGYELKSDLGSRGRHAAAPPDACLMYTPRLLLFDHRAGEVHAIRVVGPDEDPAAAEADVEQMCRRLASIGGREELSGSPSADPGSTARFALDRDEYMAAIAEARRRLDEGESYELCLTNRIDVDLDPDLDPFELYLRLRARSPAPHAAYLRLGRTTILSASPERFLRVGTDGTVEANPIKGTRRRDEDPEADRGLRDELLGSAKEQAENLMIVDVLRNDLGRVCEVGSVEVERLMEVQSFAQVHQLVSTIRGRLTSDRDPVGCVEACFPGGSMTGAPKLRSMEILDGLEPTARGPYSGALGWFGLDGGVDLSILIRSIVVADGTARIGSGGAITVLSDPEAEYEEMLLKARPLLELLGCRSGQEDEGPVGAVG